MDMRELRRNYSYHGVVYEARLLFRRRSGIRLSLRRDGTLSISVPARASLSSIDEQVAKMMAWVERQTRKRSEERERPYTYIKGQKVETNLNEEAVRAGYAKQAEEYFASRVAYFAPLMGITTPYRVKAKDMNSRVGTNSSRTKTLAFSLWLYHFSPEVIDSVVVHELAHDRVRDHSSKFYAIVLQYCPNYWELRKRIISHAYGEDKEQG